MHSTVEPDARRPAFQTFLLLCGIIGAALFGLVNIALSAANPEYILIKQPLGDLQLLPDGWIQSLDFILLGLFLFAFAAGLRIELRGGFGETGIPLMHIGVGLGCIITGLFVRYPLHAVGAILMAVSTISGLVLFALRFRGDPRWQGWFAYSMVTAGIVTLLVVAFTWSMIHRGNYTGLVERFAMITRGVWLIIFSIRIGGGVRLTRLP